MTAPDELLPCPWCGAQTRNRREAKCCVRAPESAAQHDTDIHDAPHPMWGPQPDLSTLKTDPELLRRLRESASAPDSAEFCKHCGAGIGKFRRYGEGTCPECDPQWAEHQVRVPPEDEATVNAALAPDSAPNGLADEIRAFLADAPKGRPHEGYRYGELLAAAEIALRSQPGGAVPSAETPPHVCGLKGYGAMSDVCPACALAYKRYAATKAGEGETPATDERERG